MSFGKRQSGERENSRQPRPEAQITHARRYSWPKATLGLGIGLAVIAFGSAIYVSGMRQLGTMLNKQFEAQLTVTSHPSPSLNLLQTKQADGWEFASCTLQPPQLGFGSLGPGAHADEDPFKSGFKQIAGGEETEALLNSAKFIDCITSDAVDRLCVPKVRAAFAADVSRFYKQYNAALNQPHSFRNPTDPKFAALLQTLKDAEPDIAIAKIEVDSELASSKELVDQALSRAIEKGAMTKSDFGWFAHQDVRAVFASARPADHARCQ